MTIKREKKEGEKKGRELCQRYRFWMKDKRGRNEELESFRIKYICF